MYSSEHAVLDMANFVGKYCVGMEGNVSVKLDNNSFLIKASGKSLKSLYISDLIKFDFNGNQLSEYDKKPSMEYGFHEFLLGHPEINYIAHTHPINTLRILCTNKLVAERFAKSRIFPDQVVFNGKKSCLIDYACPGEELSNLIKEEVPKFIEREGFFPKLILLRNHGIIACGKTAEECIIITEICEKAAEVFSNPFQSVVCLSEVEMDKILNHDGEKYRASVV